MAKRDNFTSSVKRALADRAGHHCSRCKKLTTGPDGSGDGVASIGVACHICAASPGGARYDTSMTTEQRRSFDNGIWCCEDCARLVDGDTLTFKVEELRKLKAQHEECIRSTIGRPGMMEGASHIRDKLNTILIRELSEIARLSGVDIGDVGLHVWHKFATEEDGQVLRRVARTRLSDITSSLTRDWKRGEGIVGWCWEKQTDVGLDLTDTRYRHCSVDVWTQYPRSITLGLDQSDFLETTQHFKAICASPIVVGETFIGCISLNYENDAAPPFSTLWSRAIKGALRRAAANAALVLG